MAARADEAELRAAVLADPDDDAARAVYGDALQARGDPRGELIAVQLRQAALTEDDPAWLELERRGRALIAAQRDAWLGPLPGGLSPRFRRGFVEDVVATDGEAAAAVATLLHAEPVTGVQLTDIDGDRTVALLEGGALRRVRRLCLTDQQGDADHVAMLAAAVPRSGPSELPALARLGVDTKELAPASVAALVGSPLFAQLRGLALTFCVHGDAAAVDLTEDAPQLTWLGLRFTSLGVVGARALSAARLPALRGLDLLDTDLGSGALAALVAGLPPLDHLALSLHADPGDVLRPLATTAALRDLRSLVLDRHLVRGELAALGAAFPALERLDLHHGRGLDVTAVRRAWPALRALSAAVITDASARSASQAVWPALRRLSLRLDARYASAIAARLAAAPALRGLVALELSDVEDDAVVSLSQASWPALRRLELRGRLTDRSLHALAAADLPVLAHLQLHPPWALVPGATITAAGQAELQARFGAVIVPDAELAPSWSWEQGTT